MRMWILFSDRLCCPNGPEVVLTAMTRCLLLFNDKGNSVVETELLVPVIN